MELAQAFPALVSLPNHVYAKTIEGIGLFPSQLELAFVSKGSDPRPAPERHRHWRPADINLLAVGIHIATMAGELIVARLAAARPLALLGESWVQSSKTAYGRGYAGHICHRRADTGVA
jgi:hypothetical protein